MATGFLGAFFQSRSQSRSRSRSGGRSFDGGAPASVWSKKDILRVLEERYGALEALGEEPGYSLYGATENDVRFAVIMVKAPGAQKQADDVVEVGFVARFIGFPLTESAAETINRNLHISVLAQDAGGDLYLIGGVVASGAFNRDAFAMVLDAWRRDMTVMLQGVSGGSLIDSHPAARLEAVQRFAANEAPAGGRAPFTDMLDRFMGAESGALATCSTCDGRGKIGFLARGCEACGGDGLVRR